MRFGRRRRFLLILTVITAVALGLRLLISVQLHGSYSPVTRPAPGTDTLTYQTLAREIQDGRYDYGKGFYYQPFYYVVFLPLVYTVTGRGPWGVIVVQALLGAAAVWLTGIAFARTFGRWTGYLGAAFLALSRGPIFYTPFTLIAALQTFWMAALTAAVVAAARRPEVWRWGVVGLICGLANATRGNMILLLPLLLVSELWSHRRQRRRQLLGALLLATLFYLPQLPFAWINYRAHGRWVGASTAAGQVLALGNTPEAPPGGREPGSSGPMTYPETYQVWMRQAETGQCSVGRNVWRWFRAEPLAWFELKFRMLLLFWNRQEIPNNVSLLEGNQPVDGWLLHSPLLLDFWLVGGLGLGGCLLALHRSRRHPARLLLVGTVFIYTGSIVLFYVLARFRLPLLPLVCGFAGVACMTLWRYLPGWRGRLGRRRLAIRAAVVLAALGVTVGGYDLYRYGWEARVLRLVRPQGVRLSFPDRDLVMDHGPQSFGGWVPVPLGTGLELEKTLLPQRPPGPAPLLARVAVYAETPAVIEVSGTGGLRQAFPLAAGGLHWLPLELQPENYVYTDDGRLHLKLSVKSVSGRAAALVVDTQRDYRRTELPVPVPGELVLTLEQPVEP